MNHLRRNALEKRVRAIDTDDIIDWIVQLEDCCEAFERAMEEPVRIMREDCEALTQSGGEDEETQEAISTYEDAIEGALAATKKWRMTP